MTKINDLDENAAIALGVIMIILSIIGFLCRENVTEMRCISVIFAGGIALLGTGISKIVNKSSGTSNGTI